MITTTEMRMQLDDLASQSKHSIANDSDDNKYEVCFVVQEVEFFTFKEGFMA